jgi:hypothetical protein
MYCVVQFAYIFLLIFHLKAARASRILGPWISSVILVRRSHWHRYPTDIVEYLREFEAVFEKVLNRELGAQMGFFDEKNRAKNRVTRSL